MPKLKKLNLTKGEGHKHPDIKIGDIQYLCKIDGSWYAGNFYEEWFGLNFNGWLGTTRQYDKPGENHSTWEEIYEIVNEVV